MTRVWRLRSIPTIRAEIWGVRYFQTTVSNNAENAPLRKQLKDAVKLARQIKNESSTYIEVATPRKQHGWELTVGIEIHAQLNSPFKLFSKARTEYSDQPNTGLHHFDVAIPGSQPIFQPAVLIPALRAALALNCTIRPVSKFDRKHYFYHDQPSGYQITQYYEPFAVDGHLLLPSNDGETLTIGIKQVQLEQDTARTQEQDEENVLIDFNRSGHPLIEIISLPQIHSPEAASAYVRKVQSILYSVDAVTTGMELGGLRADVNVSVRRVDDQGPGSMYGGVTGLGQRTEIKNLSSFKAVEDAIKAERDRQITLIEGGGTVEGETRGWSATRPGETRRLRGKEGEVDYRYMPDPDISPLYIGEDVVRHLRSTLPPVPDQLEALLEQGYGLSSVDAKSLLSLDAGNRFIYFQDIVDHFHCGDNESFKHMARMIGNWVLHELGALLTITDTQWHPELVPAPKLATIVRLQVEQKITGPSAKRLLRIVFDGDKSAVNEIVDREGLRFQPMTRADYESLAIEVMQANPLVVKDVQMKGKLGKIKFLVGQMMQKGDRNRMEAEKAESVLREKLIPDTKLH